MCSKKNTGIYRPHAKMYFTVSSQFERGPRILLLQMCSMREAIQNPVLLLLEPLAHFMLTMVYRQTKKPMNMHIIAGKTQLEMVPYLPQLEISTRMIMPSKNILLLCHWTNL